MEETPTERALTREGRPTPTEEGTMIRYGERLLTPTFLDSEDFDKFLEKIRDSPALEQQTENIIAKAYLTGKIDEEKYKTLTEKMKDKRNITYSGNYKVVKNIAPQNVVPIRRRG